VSSELFRQSGRPRQRRGGCLGLFPFFFSRVVQVFGAAVRYFLGTECTAAKPSGSAFGGAAAVAAPALPAPDPVLTPGSTPAGLSYASWGPPPAYAPPAAPPPPLYATPPGPGFATSALEAGRPSPFGCPAATPYSVGVLHQSPGPAAGAPRAVKRGLQAAIDGACAAALQHCSLWLWGLRRRRRWLGP
jgi:hypothetical protein